MARETKEQSAERRRVEAEASLAAALEYKKTVPALLMTMQAIAQEVGVSTKVSLTPTGPSVHFYDDATNIDDTITYNTEEWEIDYLRRKLMSLKEEQDARIQRRNIAEDAWTNKLTADERVAVKEHIHCLRTK